MTSTTTYAIVHLERGDGDPCALIEGHVPLDLPAINAAYREGVGLGTLDHDELEEWHHRYYVVDDAVLEDGEPRFRWVSKDDPDAKPCTVWDGP